jgi:hypothetical protein
MIRFTAALSRVAFIALLGLGATVATATAQQSQTQSSAVAVQPTESGPRVREVPRAEARFKDSAAPRYKDHTTTVTISTVVLVVALIVLVLVLI